MSRLATKEIRLQFSGYAIFAAKIISVATGFIFQAMLSRALVGDPITSPQYGIYYNISDVIAYFVMLGGVMPFWAMRYLVRGKEGAFKTGLATTAILSVIFATVYMGLISFILPLFDISLVFLPIYMIAVFQIVELYFFGLFETCLQASKPQAIGYGLILQQIAKISIAYVLIVQVGQPLLGAVVANVVSFAVHLIYYANLLAPQMKQRIQWGYVREWMKGSSITLYSVLGTQLVNFVFILLLQYGTEDGRGIFGAAFQIASIIGFASFLSFALYPKLLAERKKEDITTSIRMVLMFALPMAVGAMALADSYIMLLAPETGSFELYQQGYIVIIVLAVDALITVAGGVLSSVICGFESVDETGKMSLTHLVKSKLFKVYTLTYVQAALTIPISYYILTTYTLGQPTQSAFAIATINTVVHVFTLTALYMIARKVTQIAIPWKSMAKFLFASGVMGAVLFLPPHPTRISITLIETAVGGLIYLGVLMAIDKESRGFPKAVIKEIVARIPLHKRPK